MESGGLVESAAVATGVDTDDNGGDGVCTVGAVVTVDVAGSNVCPDELIVSSTPVTSVNAEQQSLTSDDDSMHHADPQQQLVTENDVIDDMPLVQDGGGNSDEHSTGDETGSAVNASVMNADDACAVEHGLTNDMQSQRDDDKAVVENGKQQSEETLPETSEDQSQTNTNQTIDWDALEKPKAKSSVGETAEFSQVFNKVVKQRSTATADSKDSQHSSTQHDASIHHCTSTELSLTETLHEPRSKFTARYLPLKTTKITGKTVHGAGRTKLVSSSKTDTQTGSVELMKETTLVTSVSTALAVPGKDSAVESKTISDDTETRLASGDKYSDVASRTEHEDVKSSSSVTVKTEAQSEDRFSSLDKESLAVSMAEPGIDDTRPSSHGKECSAVPVTEHRQVISEVVSGAESVHDPQTDERNVSHAEHKTKPSFQKANVRGLSSDISVPQSDSRVIEPAVSVTPLESSGGKIVTHSSVQSVAGQKHSQIEAKDQPACIPSVSDQAELSDSVSADVIPQHEAIPATSHTAATVSQSASEQSVSASKTDSYIARSVVTQQKKVVQRRFAGKVQPSESKSEEPAWVLAAKRKSDQWSDDRAEQFDRQKTAAAAATDDDADNEVSVS